MDGDDWLLMEENSMMNNNKENVTRVALNETGRDNRSEEKKLSIEDDNVNRSFSTADLWNVRRNVRSLKIHNRIPRL